MCRNSKSNPQPTKLACNLTWAPRKWIGRHHPHDRRRRFPQLPPPPLSPPPRRRRRRRRHRGGDLASNLIDIILISIRRHQGQSKNYGSKVFWYLSSPFSPITWQVISSISFFKLLFSFQEFQSVQFQYSKIGRKFIRPKAKVIFSVLGLHDDTTMRNCSFKAPTRLMISSLNEFSPFSRAASKGKKEKFLVVT